jgi:hypothetical protein
MYESVGGDTGRDWSAGGRLKVTSRPGELVAFDPVPVLRHPPVAAARTVGVSEAVLVVSSSAARCWGGATM